MKTEEKSKARILNLILRSISDDNTITSLSGEIGMTRVGVWKLLKKIQSEKLIVLKPIGNGKTSAYKIILNWENPILEKILSVLLTEEALKNQRWLNNFLEFENKVDFLVLYGSILHSPKEANDIDILNVVSDNKRFIDVEEIVKKVEKTQFKKIHAINFTEQELIKELRMQNKIFLDAIKKGVILFGQEKFIKFMKKLNEK